jgi:hypothetical protein
VHVRVAGAYFEGKMGYRIDQTSGVATGALPTFLWKNDQLHNFLQIYGKPINLPRQTRSKFKENRSKGLRFAQATGSR